MRLTPNRIALLILLLFTINAVNYAAVTPPFEASDEAAHFLYVHNLLEDGTLPEIRPREALADMDAPTDRWAIESHQPPLYYALGAALISPTTRDDVNSYLQHNEVIFTLNTVAGNPNKWLHAPGDPGGDTGLAITMLRGYSILLGLGTLWLIYRTAYLLTGRAALALLAMLFAASLPTFTSISASINNDNLVTLLYAAGVYAVLHSWHHGPTRLNVAVLALIPSAAALAKLTGASLFGVVLFGLAYGAWRGYLSWRNVYRLAGLVAIAGIVLAGWWFLRNWSLYGDALALDATKSLWSREFEVAATSGDPLAELGRIWRSFWLMVGHLHQPVYGPTWLYVYGGAALLAGVVGLGLALRRASRKARDCVLLLALVIAVLLVMLLVGTRSVDISYGRLLFPALVGLAPLMAWGWVRLAGRTGAVVIVLPLALAVVFGWAAVLPDAYARIEPVDDIPDDTPLIGASAGNLRLLSYETLTEGPVGFDDALRFTVYLKGRSERNAALYATAIDSVTLERLGHTEVFPGMAPTDSLNPEQVYRAPVRVPLDTAPEIPVRPRRVRLQLRWFSPSAFESVPLVDSAGNPVDTLLLDGPLLVDERYSPPEPEVGLDVGFGEAINLRGYTLSSRTPEPGSTLAVTLHWSTKRAIDTDWTLTVQLLNEAGSVVDQADGMIPGYPTSQWQPDMPFAETRRLHLPLAGAPTDYQLAVGWYRLQESGFQRLPVRGRESASHGLFSLPEVIAMHRLCPRQELCVTK